MDDVLNGVGVLGPLASKMSSEPATCLSCSEPVPGPNRKTVAQADLFGAFRFVGYLCPGCALPIVR